MRGLFGEPFGVSLFADEPFVTPVRKTTDTGLRRASACSSKPPNLGGIDSRAKDVTDT